ncbi:MAG: diphthine--ammonia ligase [Candidatus Aenigmarchaeota archaeon]|nr:diphthine--ammonia ligase [Candidatus Aenigmarchaeota archaeon]
MRLAALLSGGKDSLYSMYKARQEGHKIRYVIVFFSENPESYMFHIPNVHLVEEQAKLMGIECIKVPTIRNILASLKGKIDGIVTGATASNYQKTRIDNICKELSIGSMAPIWQAPPAQTLRNIIAEGFRIMIVGIAAPPLDDKWLGRLVDEQCVKELEALNEKHGIHVLFEGGEAESLVLDCPMFPRRMEVVESEKHWDAKSRSGWLEIKRVNIINKN